MRGDKESTKNVKAGSILQISPTAELAAPGGSLAVVVERHGWGVVAAVAGEGNVRIAWQHVEHTGGAIVWDSSGKRVQMEEVLKHHP